MPDNEHFHVIAVQDHGTAREWWTIRTNQYDHGEAVQAAGQLLSWEPDHQAHGDETDDEAESGDDHDAPAWSATWITRCTEPCTWAAVPPAHTWMLPAPGEPWRTADGVTPQPPARTASVSLSTIRPATEAELELLELTDVDIALLELTDSDLAALELTDADQAHAALERDPEPPSAWEWAARMFEPDPWDRPQSPDPRDRPRSDPER